MGKRWDVVICCLKVTIIINSVEFFIFPHILSCQNLIEKLEEEYKQRAKYISYLTKCKQGLLSAISHIEQVTVKMGR